MEAHNMQPFKNTHTKEYHIQIYVIVKINNNRQKTQTVRVRKSTIIMMSNVTSLLCTKLLQQRARNT